MAQTDERNFRAQYYEKMGFRCVEEKRSLEPLLRESPVDGARLAQFVRLHLVPGIYRPLVWKLLLRVQPCHSEAVEFVGGRRRETAEDTVHMLYVLGHVTERTAEPRLLWLGWLLNTGRLVTMSLDELDRQQDVPQLQVARLVADLFPDRTDRFFVSCRLWQLQQTALEQLPGQLAWLAGQLERESPQLAAHVERLGLLQTAEGGPIAGWIARLFCGVLPHSSVERVVDRLVAGAERILPLTALSLLLTHGRPLLEVDDPSAARALLDRVVEEDTDRVVNRTLELWNKLNKA